MFEDVVFSIVLASGSPVRPATAKRWGGLAGLVLFYAVAVIGPLSTLPLLVSAQTAVILTLAPVTVALIAWIFLSEALAPLQAAEMSLVVASVIGFKLLQEKSAAGR